MSKKVYDGNGHVKGEVSTGTTPKYYEHGHFVGSVKDDGKVVNEHGTVVNDLGKDWRQ